MLILRENIVYKVVLIAIFLPIFAAFFDSKTITYIPDVLSVLAFSLLLLSNRVKLNYYFYTVLLILFFYVFSSLIIYGSIASMGSVAVILLSIIFFQILDDDKIKLERLVKQVSVIYSLHVLFIFFEIIVKILGYEYLINELIGIKDSVTVMHYKDYNSAGLLRYLGFDFGGANGLLLGSQSASIVTLFSILWFANLFKINIFSGLKINNKLFFILSLFLYPFDASMTSNFIFMILMFLLIFVFNNSRLCNKTTWSALFFILTIFGGIIFDLITFRIKTEADVAEYTHTFSFLVIDYLSLDWLSQLFGSGRGSMSGVSHSGDFGIAHILYEAGFVLVALGSGALLFIFVRVIRLLKRSKYSRFTKNPWFSFMSINIILSLGWFISLGHYTPAIELGGRHIFAFHVALTLISIKKVRNLLNNPQTNYFRQ
jgi:hypothetical protein